jgi:hypothetical protein
MPEVDPPAAHDTADPDATTDHRPPCPCCGGRMIIVEVFARGAWLNAALAGIDDGHNGGGPIWAIFDSDAVAREGWQPQPPHVDIAAGFFFSANRLADLARKIVMKYQRVPMPPANLEETVVRYNSFVESGVDEDFDKPTPRHRIEKPPFYAAWATPVVHDTRAGLRIDPACRVTDMNGEVIPGLYCGGESAGGFSQHGLARAACQGYIAGRGAATAPLLEQGILNAPILEA